MAQYIDKNVVVAEIERIMNSQQEICKADVALDKDPDSKNIEVINQFQQFVIFLDLTEVKEVDLEKELNDYGYYYDYVSLDRKELVDFAKHFFELGLSVNNPITAADRGMAEEITINLKRVAQDYKIDLTKEIEWLGNQVSRITIMDKEKYDFIDHVVHLTLVEEDRLLNEHGGEYSGLEEDGIDSNEYYRIIAERVITILKKNNNYIQEELANIPDKKSPTNEEIGDYDHEAVMESLHPQLKEKAGWLEELEAKLNTLSKEELQRLMQKYEEKCNFKEEPVSEDLEAAIECCGGNKGSGARVRTDFIMGAKWQKEHLWKPADGDDLPEIDREVIVLLDNGKVVFAHRPPEYWDGKNIVTGKVTRNYPKTYDKGGWNQPNVKWWLDCQIPKTEED